MLTQKEMEKVASLVGLAYEVRDRDSILGLMSEAFPDLFGNSSSVFIPIDPQTGNMKFVGRRLWNHHERVLLQYILYYAPFGPFVKSGWLGDLGSTVAFYSDIVSYPGFEESAYMREFMSQVPMHYCLGIKFLCQGDLVGILGLHRTKGLGDFSPRERMIAELVAPHFSKALHRISFLESADLSGEIEVPVMILDLDGNPIYANEKARRIIEGSPTSEIPEPGLGTMPMFFRARGGVYRLRSFSLGTAFPKILPKEFGELRDRRSRKGVRVVFLEPMQERFPVRKRMQEQGLTPRQQQVVSKVAQGYSNRGISESLGISEQTVKDHLHDIFEKLRIRNRCELILYFGDRTENPQGTTP